MLLGHSGGEAIEADTLGRDPTIAQGALLVSCPCDLAAWRSHMLKLQKNPAWLLPVRSLPPIVMAGDVASTVHVRTLVGGKDNVAPPELTEAYTAAFRARGIDIRATIAPDLSHDILLEAPAFEQLRALAETMTASIG